MSAEDVTRAHMRYDRAYAAELNHFDDLRRDDGLANAEPGVFVAVRSSEITAIARDGTHFRQGGYQHDPRDIPEGDRVLSEIDPPLHTAARRAFMLLITPNRLRKYENLVTERFRLAVDRIAPAGRADIVKDIAKVVPATVIGIMANVSEEMLPRVAQFTSDYHASRTGEADEEALERVAFFRSYVKDEITKRRSETTRGTDWLSLLLECTDEHGNPLPDDRLTTMFTVDVLVGGSETTRNVIAKLFYYILSTPGLYERLRENRSLASNAVEEALRMAPSVPQIRRRVREAVTVSGTDLPKESLVVLNLEAANYDGTKYENPREYRHDRANAKGHLAFGHGAHHCVGAPLARLELIACLNAFLDRISSMRLVEEYTNERSLSKLEVTFEPC